MKQGDNHMDPFEQLAETKVPPVPPVNAAPWRVGVEPDCEEK
jgi:hypothetical protein